MTEHATTDDYRLQFSARLADLLASATQLMPPDDVSAAAVAAASHFALRYSDGPRVADLLRHVAAEMQSLRQLDPATGSGGACH